MLKSNSSIEEEENIIEKEEYDSSFEINMFFEFLFFHLKLKLLKHNFYNFFHYLMHLLFYR